MTVALLILLGLSAVANIFGIVFTHRDAPAGIDENGPYIQRADTWWERSRATVALGIGLLLNTAAGFLAVATAAAPAA